VPGRSLEPERHARDGQHVGRIAACIGSGAGNLGVSQLYGLTYAAGTMWGVSGTDIYSIDLTTGNTTYSATVQRSFTATWGATMVAVPVPPALWMGLTLLAGPGLRLRRGRHS